MLIPELPSYLSRLGGGEYKGLIIALFTATAGISRPFSGKLTDTIGRVPVMALGSLVCFICGFIYPAVATIGGFLLLRLFHGFSTGFKPTATAAYIADIIPSNRWGEALGIHGICFSTGMAIGPALGSLITARYSIDVLFYCSSFFALMSIVILLNLKETQSQKQSFRFSLFRIGRHEILDLRVLPAAIITFLGYISYGVVLTLIPDWSHHLGISNKGLFFVVFTLSSLLVRFIAGKVSDRHGRVIVLKLALTLLVLSLILIGSSSSIVMLLSGAFFYGIATGLFSPASSAWTVDLSHPDHRGKAVATMYIALEAGIGMGALLSGWIFGDVITLIPYIFFGNPSTFFMMKGMIGNATWQLAPTIPLVLFAMFQLKFAVITPALITGAFAERIRFGSYLIFISLFMMLIYTPLAHATWHPDGLLFKYGVLDFAGGTVVHMSAGWAALASALYLKQRRQQQHSPARITYVMLGTGLLWFGWFGFNAGSAVGAGTLAATALGTTTTASAAAGFAWILFDMFRRKKPSVLGFCIGAVVGLVAITPAAGFITVPHSLITGIVAAIISNLVVQWRTRTTIDDTLDVFPCHGVGGMVGMLCTGIFANQSVNAANTTGNGLYYGETHLFLVHLVALVIVSAFAFFGSLLLLKVTDLISPLRVTAEEEEIGLDESQHGEKL